MAYLPFEAPAADWTPPTPPELDRYDTIYLDTETDGLEWYRGAKAIGVAVGTPDGTRRYLPFGHAGGNLDRDLVRRWAQRELRGKRIVGLNIRFDLHMLRTGLDVDLREQDCTFHDVAHAEALLDDHCRSFSLEAIAQRRLGMGKLQIGPKDRLAEEHASAVAPYAERDVELPHLIDDVQRPLLAAEGLERVMRLEDDVIPVVVELEKNGAPLDVAKLEQWERESRRLQTRMTLELADLCGFHVNPDSSNDLLRLCQLCQVRPAHYTATGRASFPAEWMAKQTARPLELAYQLGKLIDLRSKYLLKYLQDMTPDGMLYPSFNQLKQDEGGTVSGRFSAVRPNLQQVMGADKHHRAYGWIPEALMRLLGYSREQLGCKTIKDKEVLYAWLIKELFVPGAGTWLAADAKQIEYRLFAHYANSQAILRRYAEDPETDFHAIVMALIAPVRPEITRTEVKTFNFLKIYGGGVSAAAKNLGVDASVAAEISDAYDAQFPEARKLLNEAMRVAERRGYVLTMMGRRARFPGKERTHSALNRVIQGTAAEENKLMLVDVYRERKTLGLTLRLTVHDELDADLHDPSRLPHVRDFLNQRRLPTRVPILWDVNVGANWADAK